MSTELLVLGAIALGTVVTVVGAVVASRRASRERRELEAHLEDALAAELGPGLGTHLEESVTLKRLAVVDDRDGEPVYVPIVHVPLGTTDAPGMGLVFEYVASVLEVVHPLCADVHVRHYDVQFSFGPGGLLVSGECRRVSVPLEMGARVCEEPTYRAHDLRRDVEEGDDGDDTHAPVLWGACEEYDDAPAVAGVTAGTI